ncbi:MAG: DNA-formamidopyrimidine glycosylase family protein [Desulfobacterales bacterium]
MPELPDVEIFRRIIDDTSLNRTIERCRVLDAGILESVSKTKIQSELKGNAFEETARYGKYALARLKKGEWMTLHFGMTGFVTFVQAEDGMPKHVRLLIDFDGENHLAYDCTRKLGKIGWTKDIDTFVKKKKLGVDALDVTYDAFQKMLAENRSGVKSFLMKQNTLCGIGNVYSDEVCFQARIHPQKETNGLDKKESRKLYESMKSVLETAIERRADPEKMPEKFLISHRKEDADCPGCNGKVHRIKISGRSAYYCPACQKS